MKIKKAFRVWQRNFTVYTKLYKSNIALNFVDPAIYLLGMGFGIGHYVNEINGEPYVNFIATGIIASSAMFATAYECTYGTYVRMTFQKTFDAILATPINIDDLILGELLWGATKGAFYGSVIILVISLFGLIHSPMIILSIFILFISSIIFAEISMIFTALIPGIDSFNYFFTLIISPMFLFSGIFFPLDTMPKAVSDVAFYTPLYHTVNVCRAFAKGNFFTASLDIIWIFIVAVILAPIPFALIKKRVLK